MGDRPRWFRFSLRTLFVAVTFLCVWLGWQFNQVRLRREARQAFELKGFQFISAEAYAARYPQGQAPGAIARISPLRSWFGDLAIQEIWYEPGFPAANQGALGELQSAFPEAELREVLYEPCHPGCFPAGTIVQTAEGARRIETIVPGEPITVISMQGAMTTMPVSTVFVTENRIWRVETSAGTLHTTQTQPLCLADGTTRQVGRLKIGDRLLRFSAGAVREAEIIKIDATRRAARVYNLILRDSERFCADGFIVRSKPPADR